MTYEEFIDFVKSKCKYETIYEDSEGRLILVIDLLGAYNMVTSAQPDLTAENMQALREKKFKAAQLSLWATSVTNAPPIQVSPLEFVTRVAGREEATGPPTLWTQWPTPKIDPNQWAFDHGLEST